MRTSVICWFKSLSGDDPLDLLVALRHTYRLACPCLDHPYLRHTCRLACPSPHHTCLPPCLERPCRLRKRRIEAVQIVDWRLLAAALDCRIVDCCSQRPQVGQLQSTEIVVSCSQARCSLLQEQQRLADAILSAVVQQQAPQQLVAIWR